MFREQAKVKVFMVQVWWTVNRLNKKNRAAVLHWLPAGNPQSITGTGGQIINKTTQPSRLSYQCLTWCVTDHRHTGQVGTRSGCHGDRCIRWELLWGGHGPSPGLLLQNHSVRLHREFSSRKSITNVWNQKCFIRFVCNLTFADLAKCSRRWGRETPACTRRPWKPWPTDSESI